MAAPINCCDERMGERGRTNPDGDGRAAQHLKAEWESRLGAQHKGLLMSATSLHTLNTTWLPVRRGRNWGVGLREVQRLQGG